jgi:hypothetical protein
MAGSAAFGAQNPFGDGRASYHIARFIRETYRE